MVVGPNNMPGEVTAQVAIIIAHLPAFKPNFRAVVELWYPAHGEESAEAKLHYSERPVKAFVVSGVFGASMAHDASSQVMIIKQRHQPICVAVSTLHRIVIIQHARRLI